MIEFQFYHLWDDPYLQTDDPDLDSEALASRNAFLQDS